MLIKVRSKSLNSLALLKKRGKSFLTEAEYSVSPWAKAVVVIFLRVKKTGDKVTVCFYIKRALTSPNLLSVKTAVLFPL